jgi:hypothetical protein
MNSEVFYQICFARVVEYSRVTESKRVIEIFAMVVGSSDNSICPTSGIEMKLKHVYIE